MYVVAALYHFTRIDQPADLREPLLRLCESQAMKGTLLLAHEGINGTIAGTREGVEYVLQHIRQWPNCNDLTHKESEAQEMPFNRMKVRLKKEIVTMGKPNIDPTAYVGHYVKPQDWDILCVQDDVVVLDTRNNYEYSIGTFPNAINPEITTFREFPNWWEENATRFAGKKVAMFCTGGIRCEKASHYLIQQGVRDVYHLHGGILKYLEDIPEAASTWQGECFVFDQRVSVKHGLEEGSYTQCYGCRMPLLPEDLEREEFVEGVSCHHCLHNTTEQQRAGFRERHRQMQQK